LAVPVEESDERGVRRERGTCGKTTHGGWDVTFCPPLAKSDDLRGCCRVVDPNTDGDFVNFDVLSVVEVECEGSSDDWASCVTALGPFATLLLRDVLTHIPDISEAEVNDSEVTCGSILTVVVDASGGDELNFVLVTEVVVDAAADASADSCCTVCMFRLVPWG